MTLPSRQHGIAVISAILIAAIVASLAFALSARERQWLNQTENRQDLQSALSLALSAIDLARLTLRDDLRNGAVDHLLEPWTIPVPPLTVDKAQVSGRLIELQGRFNLTNLQNNGKVDPESVAALQRLLALRNLPTGWAAALAEAVAGQVRLQERQGRTSDSETKTPVTIGNTVQIAQVAGIPSDKFASLEEWVALLPERTAVNVNFAPPEIIHAITKELPLKEAEIIVARRVAKPFGTTMDFIGVLPEAARRSLRNTDYTVESQYFLAEIETSSGRAQVRLEALIHRTRNQFPQLLWISRR